MAEKKYFFSIVILFFILFSSQKLHADYKLGVFLEEMCFENGYGFAYTKERSSIACKPYGVVINNFANPSLAKDIGVKQMDVIVNFDGKDTKTMRAFVNQFSSTKHKINHEMIIHRWNNSLGKMEQFKVSFKVPGKSENIEKKTVKNIESNKSSKLKNQKIEEELFVSIDNLVIRKKPNGKKIGNLYKNNKVVIYDKNDDKSWTLVKDTNTNLIGWVSSKYLSKNKVTIDNKDQNLEIAKNDNKEEKNIKTETKKEKPKEKLYIGSYLATINLNTKIIRFNDSETFTPKNKDNISYTYKDLGDNKKQIIINGEGIFKFKNGEVYEGQIKDSKIDGVGRYKFGKFNEYTYTGNFVNGQKNGNGKLEFNANVYNKWARNEYDNIRKEKYKELKTAKEKRNNLLSEIEKLDIKKISSQSKNKENLILCENINKKIADDFDFDISNWDNNNCSQFKLLKCERLCYHKTDSFDSCNNCHKQVGILPEENTSIDSQIDTYKIELSKYDKLINELQNSYENVNFSEKFTFSIKSSWNNGEMDLSNPIKMTFSEANTFYDGFINDDFEPNGIGELVFGKKVIKGEWVNGSINNQATLKFPNNDIVIGPLNFHYLERLFTFENFDVEKLNITNQDYKINFSNGDVYSGTIKIKSENLNTSKFPFLLHGFGKITYKSGDQYEGEWINDLKSGLGEYQSKDGDLYNGQWKEDKKHNQGTMIYKNGEKYEGEWKENKRDGSGTLFDSENIIIQKGLYIDDDFLEGYNDNKYIYANGNIYEGELDDYFPYGYGIVLNKEGKLISKGKFQKNKKTGLFIEFLANQYKLIDYDYVNGKEKEIITNIEILEICRPEAKKNDNCYGKTKINFLNEKNLNGTFIGVFKDNHPSNGIIKFGKNEKRLDYFSGNILEDKHGYKYDGQLFYLDDNFYFEGVYAILFPEKNKNYQFLGKRYNRKNGNTKIYELDNENNEKITFINNYTLNNDRSLILKKDIKANKIKFEECKYKFYETKHLFKEYEIIDYKDVANLRKKRSHYEILLKKYNYALENIDNNLQWSTPINASGLHKCYSSSYNEIINPNEVGSLAKNKNYNISLISKNYFVLSNGLVIERFQDKLTNLESNFYNFPKNYMSSLNEKDFDIFLHAIFDYSSSKYSNEIFDFKKENKTIQDIKSKIKNKENENLKIDDNNSLNKKEKKAAKKELKKEIKLLNKELKEKNKEIQKIFKWNNFEYISNQIAEKVKEQQSFITLNLTPTENQFSSIERQIENWEILLESDIRAEKEKKARIEKAKKDEEKRIKIANQKRTGNYNFSAQEESEIQRCREAVVSQAFNFITDISHIWDKYNCSQYGFKKCKILCAIKYPYDCRDTGCLDTWVFERD